MQIFNTMTRRKEEFTPQKEGEYRIYVCGPTVYNYIHIGNARPLCVFDTFRRYLEYRGYKVRFVQNFTDIDDKIIKKAIEEGSDYKTVSEKYIKEYWTDTKGMNVREATVHPRATENIDEIIDIISTLVEKGYAYPVSNGDVYFSPSKFKEYGKLSHQPLEDLEAGARINVEELKKEPMDFALWKGAKPGEPYWESPWGNGRPGWHIECSAMVRRFLGKTIDIHCGGQDLIFPHHENEIAQSECCNGVPFAHYWMHNGYINVDNVKMSKSLGNFFTVRDVAEKYGYDKLTFLTGDIADYEGVSKVDMVVTLHACDTATDYALEKALEWDAKVILSVPCCQHELNKQMENEILKPVLKYGLIKERIAALVTDALRAGRLEEAGYQVQILEFIDMEHTPKNILIRAVKKRHAKEDNNIEASIKRCEAALRVSPTLGRLLDGFATESANSEKDHPEKEDKEGV